MQLEECYEAFGGSYEDIKKRLHKDEVIQKFVVKFLNDTSYATLCTAMQQEDYGEAFRAVHTLKGVCQNLSFRCLGQSAQLLTECLRGTDAERIDRERCENLLQKVSEDYEVVVGAVRRLQG